MRYFLFTLPLNPSKDFEEVYDMDTSEALLHFWYGQWDITFLSLSAQLCTVLPQFPVSSWSTFETANSYFSIQSHSAYKI
jgi:hypothetical protein